MHKMALRCLGSVATTPCGQPEIQLSGQQAVRVKRSCRLSIVTNHPSIWTAALTARRLYAALLRPGARLPWCSLRGRSGARRPRHARAPGALRVAAGGSAPLFPFVARHGLCRARSGREGRCADRTGRRELGGRRVGYRVAFGVEGDGAGRCPVAGLPAPAPRVALPRRLIERVARPEQIAILAGMALAGVT